MTTSDLSPHAPSGVHPGDAATAGASGEALRPAKPPVGTGSSPLFAQLIALAFIGLGVVGVQALLVSLGAVSDQAWTSAVVDSADGISASSPLVLVVGVAAVVLGLLLLPVVVRRRPRTGTALTATTGVYLRRRDLATVLESALDGTDALTAARVRTTRRSVRIDATSVGSPEGNSDTEAAIAARVAPVLDALERTPRLSVTIRNEGI